MAKPGRTDLASEAHRLYNRGERAGALPGVRAKQET